MFHHKFSLCFLIVLLSIAISMGVPVQKSTYDTAPVITIRNSKEMPPSMKLEAKDVLTRAFQDNIDDPLEYLGKHFEDNYPKYDWHVVDFNGYYVHSIKSISFNVGDDKYYLLFSTPK